MICSKCNINKEEIEFHKNRKECKSCKKEIDMRIKSFNQFINEEISGTEMVGPVGPAYGETRIQNKTISDKYTTVIFSDIDGKFYSIDDYQDLYQNYLKSGGSPLDGFSKKNIDRILSTL